MTVTSYIETDLVIEGVVYETQFFDNESDLQKWLTNLRVEQAESVNVPWHVYRIDHPHEPHLECECAQYLLGHRPTYIIG